MKPPKSIGAADGAHLPSPPLLCAQAKPHFYLLTGVLGLGAGAYFPHAGRFSCLVTNVGQVEEGTVGVRQRRML